MVQLTLRLRQGPLPSPKAASHKLRPWLASAGPQGVGAIFRRIPPLLMAHPRQTDKWDLRIVQLAAFHHTHRHCCIPQVPAPEGSVFRRMIQSGALCAAGCLPPHPPPLLHPPGASSRGSMLQS